MREANIWRRGTQTLRAGRSGVTVACFSEVVGVFPGPRFDDAEGADATEADIELLGWEDCAENMSFRVDKAWRQRCSQRFRNILDMIAKKADHSVLRLLQISQQHIESQLERVKHERELWKEVVERRQQQPLQLALSLKDNAAASGTIAPAAPQSARGLSFYLTSSLNMICFSA